MAFPTIVLANIQEQNDTSGTRTWPTLTGSGLAAGDLLVLFIMAYQATTTNATFSGYSHSFTELVDAGTGGSTMGVGVAYKWSDGTETGTPTCTQAATVTGNACMGLWVLRGVHATSPPEATAIATGTTAAADPASLSPSWGADDTIWLYCAGSGETSAAGAWTGVGATQPTNYTAQLINGTVDISTIGQVDIGLAFRKVNAASENAGTWSSTDVSNARNAAIIVAVRPAAPPATLILEQGFVDFNDPGVL